MIDYVLLIIDEYVVLKELNHFDKSHLEMQNDAPPTDDEDASSASGNDYEGSTSAVDPDGEMSAVTSGV